MAETNDAMQLALAALVWTLQEPARADRLLGLTGLDADGMRARVNDPAMLEAVLGFLAAHEPDLLACARDIGISPAEIVTARARLAQ